MSSLPMRASCLLFLALAAVSLRGQETKPGGKGIDPVTVAAYENLGAIYGAMGTDLDPAFREGREHAAQGVPGFRLRTFPQGKLPQVAVPFGLDFTGSDVTDKGLKGLAGLTNLAALNLAVTQVTRSEERR